MPRRRRTSPPGSDSDCETTQTQSDARGGQTRPASLDLASPEAVASVSAVVRYVLMSQTRVRPVRLDEIRKHVLSGLHGGKMARRIVSAAGEQLEEVFGLRLVELERPGEFILINCLPRDEHVQSPRACHVQLSDSEQRARGLTMVLLAVIFMNDNAMTEGAMWSFLERVGLLGDGRYSCFGDVKKFVTVDLVRARFVRTTAGTAGNDGRPSLEFSWGQQAQETLQPLDVLRFVCQIWGDNVEPAMWTSQYKRATLQQQQQ